MAKVRETASPLPLTGERTVPDVAAENYWFRRHEAAYEHVARLVAGRVVVEVGCGEGYGTALLADRARAVVGIDYDALTVRHAGRAYATAGFVRANLAALPVADAAADVVATLQVVEHVWDHAQFVRECRRVLRPDGLLVMTTPNRLTFSPGLDRPTNPFHTYEFTAAELEDLLQSNGFATTTTFGLHPGARLSALDDEYGSFPAAQLATPPADWPAALLRDVADIVTGDFVIAGAETAEVDQALDLLILARPA